MPEPQQDGPDAAMIEVRVKALDDTETVVRISNQNTIQSLVDIGRHQLNITSGSQRIIFQGRVLDPTQTIESAGILNGHAVHLVNRSPSGRNDSPNINTDRAERLRDFDRMRLFAASPEQFFRRPVRPTERDRERDDSTTAVALLPPIRVPAALSTTPVLASHFNRDVVSVDSYPLRARTGPVRNLPRDINTPPFNQEPHVINWTVRVVDTHFPRDSVHEIVNEAVRSLQILPEEVKSLIRMRWVDNRDFVIEVPRLDPHIPSPALEKLDFLCFWTDYLQDFVELVEEPNGLIFLVKEVLEMTRNNQTDDQLSTGERERRMSRLDDVIRNLEILSTGLSHMKDYERERFKRNPSEEYLNRKIERHTESNNNPQFLMRHALDIDMTDALRKFREVRNRIGTMEALLDDVMDAGALKFARDQQSASRDYRYQAISVFHHYMQRARHQLAHCTHLTSELNVCFLTPSTLQRLLPQYATNTLVIPYGHPATLTLKFGPTFTQDAPLSVPIADIFEPPRRCSDVGDRRSGDWPYLPFHPPSVHMEAGVAPQRRVVDPRVRLGTARVVGRVDIAATGQAPPGGQATPAQAPGAPIDMNDRTAFLAAVDPNTGLSINDIIQHQQQELEMFIGRIPGIDGSRVRVQARPVRRAVTTGDAPSVPVETQPPPQEAQVRVTNRFNVNPNARGFENATFHALPVNIEPNELQRIARNIASRYRADALQRIAASLADRFRQENWDSRIDSMPLCTLRECVAVALEMLTSAGATVNESKDLMLALVRDEEVLVRAVAECFKSLFGRGEFPTHVARIIMPRNEAASSRNDYEDVDQEGGEELENMVVRMPSDISQPASGDLRAIRNQRDTRRARLAAAPPSSSPTPGASSAGPSTSSAANPPGPSFNPDDMNEIRAGRLPGQSRRRVREAVYPQPSGPPQMLPNRPESPGNIVMTFHGHSHIFMPSSPPGPAGPSTSGGSTNPQQRQRPVSQSPASPDPNRRRTSAPSTVTSSPTQDSEDAVEAVARSSEAVRAARAQIDQLAANFTGQLPEERPVRSAPAAQARTLPVEIPVVNNRPMVAIDPFMACNHHQCEINRLQAPDTHPDSDRFNLQSLQPDPELLNHLINLRPTQPRRGQRTATTDNDYNYEVLRTFNGEVVFNEMDTFNRFIRTALRSILSHCIDADSLLTLNMNPVSGYVQANHTELSNMVRRHINHPPYTQYNHIEEPHLLAAEANRRVLRERQDAMANELLAHINQGREQPPPRPRRRNVPERPIQGIYRLEDVFTIGNNVDTDISYLPSYINNPQNPRPTGFFGIVYDMMRNRFDSRETILLTRRPNPALGRYLEDMREHLIRHLLSGNRQRIHHQDMHRIAENLANEESFFQQFLDQHPNIPRTFSMDDDHNDRVPVAWMFRQIEITVIKSIITLALYALRNATTENHLVGVISAYLARNLLVFYLIANRDPVLQIDYALHLSTFIAHHRFRGERPEGQYEPFVESWDRIITYWFSNYNDCTEEVFFDYIRATRAGTDWNDVQIAARFMPPPTTSSESSRPSTSGTSGSSETSSEASGPAVVVNPRKRPLGGGMADDDGVDVASISDSQSTSSGGAPASKRPRQDDSN